MTDTNLLERIRASEAHCNHDPFGPDLTKRFQCEDCQLSMMRALAVDLLAHKDEIELAYLALRMVVYQAKAALDAKLYLSAHAILTQALKGSQPHNLADEREECRDE